MLSRHSLFKVHNVNVNIVVLQCQKCNQCLQCQVSGHKSLGSLFEIALWASCDVSLSLHCSDQTSCSNSNGHHWPHNNHYSCCHNCPHSMMLIVLIVIIVVIFIIEKMKRKRDYTCHSLIAYLIWWGSFWQQYGQLFFTFFSLKLKKGTQNIKRGPNSPKRSPWGSGSPKGDPFCNSGSQVSRSALWVFFNSGCQLLSQWVTREPIELSGDS